MRLFLLPLVLLPLVALGNEEPRTENRGPQTKLLAGAAEVDITPDYPVRLSGFGGRRKESEGVRQRIYVRALVLGDGNRWHALLALDGLTPLPLLELPSSLASLAFTATHTHSAPMVAGLLPTLFGQPIPPEHQGRIDEYTRLLNAKVQAALSLALRRAQPATLSFALGSVSFAANRRTAGGPIDHDLPLLMVRAKKDNSLIALWTSYACHAVTLSDNRISGDWPGYAAETVQRRHPGAVCLISIGCAGDQNPTSGVTGAGEDKARAQGAEIADEIDRLLKMPAHSITAPLTVKQESIKLPLAKLPTKAEWEERAKRDGAVGYHARFMLEKLAKGETLPTELDYPISTWCFGDQLALVFVPGEVVVDYSLRLKDELDRHRVVVCAYANACPGYIPSERVLKEGGYEGGDAMIYYGLPGPYASGLEKKIIAAVKELVGPAFTSPYDSTKLKGTKPLSPWQAVKSLQVHPQFEVELVAAEPLINSPVAIDWGLDGKLYVAEMLDYPTGVPGSTGPAGRIKLLSDTNSDGHFDTAQVFLEGIPFPTGVTSYKKGVLICAAPSILYAEDTNGDGRADVVKKLFTGFGTGNMQARVNSLEYGLDGWIYGACGLAGGNIKSELTGKVCLLGDRDFRMKPETGDFEAVQGRSQQGRTRDDWGNWFGCDSVTLAWHFPLDEAMLRRNPYLTPPPAAVLVPEGPDPNRVFPRQKGLQLFELSGPPGLATAACGICAYRDHLLGAGYQNNLFVCEPVNGVVTRLILEPRQSTFVGKRAPEERGREFLASDDPWFRPVQAKTGPDGALYLVDMHRFVIEHPMWIPFDEKQQLDLRAGSTMGRIFRVKPKGAPLRKVPRLDQMKPAELVASLQTPNGWVRDRACALLGRVEPPRDSLRSAYALAATEQAILHLTRPGDDAYFKAAVESGFTRERLPSLAASVAASLSEHAVDPATVQVLQRLLRYALLWQEQASLEQLRKLISQKRLGGYQPWQFECLALLRAHELRRDPAGSHGERMLVEEARRLAASPDDQLSLRLAALACLGYDLKEREADAKLAFSLLTPQMPSQLQAAAVQLLGRGESPLEETLLAAAWPPLSPALKSQLLDLYLDRPAWHASLVGLLEKGTIPPATFDATRRQRFLQAVKADQQPQVEKLFAGASNPNRQSVLASFHDAASLHGDRQRGQTVFTKSCAACHRLGNLGHQVGPDLAMTSNKSPAYLLQEILDPNRQADPRYQEYVALLKSGKLATGLLLSESGHSVTLRGQEAKDQVLLRSDLEDLKGSGKSLMPEGFEKDLTKQDLADVIAFIRAVEPAPKQFIGNQPRLVVRTGNHYALPATSAEIFGPSLVYESPFRNLGFWHSLEDKAAWKVQVEAAGAYDVWLDWSCDDDCAGNLWVLEGGAKPLSGKTTITGGWDRYRRGKIGTIELPAGTVKLTFRAGGTKISQALLDLRALYLVAAGQEPSFELQVPGSAAPPPQPSPSREEGASIAAAAKVILDDSKPETERQAAIARHRDQAAELIVALTRDLKPGETKEENRRIPWIWRVAIATGKRDVTGEQQASASRVAQRRMLEVSLPKANESLRDWQAVVIGGGLINGLSQQNQWPGRYFGELLQDQPELKARWERSLVLAAAMADDEKVIPGTRYDALRMIALRPWADAKPQLAKYLTNANEELQQGAISGLADCEPLEAMDLLLAEQARYGRDNWRLAMDAFLRTEARTEKLLTAMEKGMFDPNKLALKHKSALRQHANPAIKARAVKLLGD